MNLRYITCSDIRENILVNDVINLLKISPKVEIGVQAHSSNMANGKPRNAWLNKILDTSNSLYTPLNIALHVNYDWCNAFCTGRIPPELQMLLNRKHKITGTPLIKRWQLNIGDNTITPKAKQVAKIISSYPGYEFIFPYNTNAQLQKFIDKLNNTGVRFSLLFDASYGNGITPVSWQRPVYFEHYQGYAGGLSPENVTENLDKIAKVAGNRRDIWIDAEGRLMKPGTRVFDLYRAEKYIKAALIWEQKQK